MVILQAKSVMERCKRQTLWNGRTTITQRVARFSARRCILQLKKLTDGKSGTIFRPHPNLKSTKQSIHDDFLMPRTSLNPASRKGMQWGAHRPLMKGWRGSFNAGIRVNCNDTRSLTRSHSDLPVRSDRVMWSAPSSTSRGINIHAPCVMITSTPFPFLSPPCISQVL